jgi:hypothetical protein
MLGRPKINNIIITKEILAIKGRHFYYWQKTNDNLSGQTSTKKNLAQQTNQTLARGYKTLNWIN